MVALDVFFIVFHSLLIVFNLLGWLYRPLRRLNLITLLLTGASWFLLGAFYGLGYCPLTDWHWQVLYALGEQSLPTSYVQYLAERLLGIEMSTKTADILTGLGFLVALALSLFTNFSRRFRKDITAKSLS
jgi:hypothetical protein